MVKRLCPVILSAVDDSGRDAYLFSQRNHSTGDYSSAADFYTNGLALAPDHAPGYLTLGNCCFHLGALDAAVVAYRRALEIDPDYSEAQNNLSIAEEQNALSRAA